MRPKRPRLGCSQSIGHGGLTESISMAVGLAGLVATGADRCVFEF